MTQSMAFDPDVECTGQALITLVNVAGRYAPLLRKIIAKHGIEGLAVDRWYPLSPWLDALREVEASLGEHTLFNFGKKSPEGVRWPGGISTIHAALASVDVAYHMNHRLHGQVMFDQATSTMKEGIGHYHVHHDGDRAAIMVCENPYPSNLDRGIITGIARQFKRDAEVIQDDTRPSRKRGGESCTYIVKW